MKSNKTTFWRAAKSSFENLFKLLDSDYSTITQEEHESDLAEFYQGKRGEKFYNAWKAEGDKKRRFGDIEKYVVKNDQGEFLNNMYIDKDWGQQSAEQFKMENGEWTAEDDKLYLLDQDENCSTKNIQESSHQKIENLHIPKTSTDILIDTRRANVKEAVNFTGGKTSADIKIDKINANYEEAISFTGFKTSADIEMDKRKALLEKQF